MSLLYKRYLNQEQKIMNTGNRNISKEIIQMLIALPPKSWSKPSTLIVILESCFGQYLDLSADNNARFQIKMVYDLLKLTFMYENKDKMDKVRINYYGMPICFGLKEFAIVIGLKCYPPSPSQVIPTLTQKKAPRTPRKSKGKSSDHEDLVSIVSPSFKNKNLIEALKGKGLSKKHKKSLCLVWFVHNILWVRDVSPNLINLFEDLEVFNSYPWGYESFKMTVQYLLTPLTPKTVNLYGFPWAFMAWAFEAIPYLRQQVNYQEEVSCPRILIWLSAKIDNNEKFLDLFNPPRKQKIILEGGLVAVDDGSGSGSGSGAAVGYNDASLIIFETTIHYDYDHTSCTDFATSSECSACKCQDYKVKHDGVINTINALISSVKKMTSKRGVIISKRISYSYTPLEIKAAKRRRKDTFKALSSIKKRKIAMPMSLSCTDVQCARATREQHEPKKVDVTIEATAEEHNITVYNPSTASKKEEKNCGPFVVAYAEYLRDGLQVPNDGIDAGLLHKRYATLL
ncbi:hypothetical protein BC332_00930 [Capsicum chinense]|nr:hypothetical protein BC332_00930 [Capsicum chinense]